MNLVPISALEDARLDVYRMVRDRDMAGRANAFMVEGLVALEAMIDHGRYHPSSVLVADRRLEGVRSVLERLPDTVPVYVVPYDVMVQVVGFKIHRGLLATGQRAAPLDAAALLSQLPKDEPATVLVLEGLTDADNVGASFRNAAAFGAAAVLMDKSCCDPLYRKAIRVSVGHALGLPFARHGTTVQTLEALKAANFTPVALALSPTAKPLHDFKPPKPARVALIVGTEGSGLTPQTLQACPQHLIIPMAERVDSLNVATSAAIALHHLWTQTHLS